MPTFWSPVEKRLRRLDALRRVGREAAAVEVAVDLVVRHGQELGPMARRAGASPYRLRKAVFADPESVAKMQRAEEQARVLLARRGEGSDEHRPPTK
ncbi:hypothetical protein ACH4UT_34650 [Streptomyces sp. NPDC020799]|uniref:hypothetical protein n=1 Tax=Streptomyces sp. NPDC020799 TaxID=3365091 RepID=UPI00378D003D